jgi:hypothetical protein
MLASLNRNPNLLHHEIPQRNILAGRELELSRIVLRVARLVPRVGEEEGLGRHMRQLRAREMVGVAYFEVIEHGMPDQYAVFQEFCNSCLDLFEWLGCSARGDL